MQSCWKQFETRGLSISINIVAGLFGLKFLYLKSERNLLREIVTAPDFLVMHAGGNNIGLKRIPLYKLIEFVCDHLDIFKQRYPNSILVWS